MSEATKDQRADALVASYERAGYLRVTPAILQPAEPFLDLSGEDIRRRMYLVSDPGAGDLCLRPDLTIPVALDYLASGAGRPAAFCYLGPIFRQRLDGPAEFLQAGIESFGRIDTAAADAETLALAIEATALYGLAEPEVRMGDLALFAAFIGALDLSPAWKRRLAKDFNRKASFAEDLDRLVLARPNGAPEYQGVLAALTNADPKGAHALVTDLLSIAGITAVGGRSVGEIADRFLEQAALGAGSALPGDTRKLIERFLAIGGDPDEALAELRALAADAKLALGPALDLFESRAGFLAARGVNLRAIRFATAFGRGQDYYTGMVFELHEPGGKVKGELVAGGRYDGLFARLGASPVPAVGFAAWLDGLVALGGEPGGQS
jgi:ATP phosphoribosyltransferase regulatory subunit